MSSVSTNPTKSTGAPPCTVEQLLHAGVSCLTQQIHRTSQEVLGSLKAQIACASELSPSEFVASLLGKMTEGPVSKAEQALLERVTACVRRGLQQAGFGQAMALFSTSQLTTWVGAAALPKIAQLNQALSKLDSNYLVALGKEDKRLLGEASRKEALVKKLSAMTLEAFTAKAFNQDEDRREAYREVWFERYHRLLNYARNPQGELIAARVSTARDGLFRFSLCSDPQLTRIALETLIAILDEADPEEVDCAHNLELLERSLRERLTPENIEAQSTEVQRLVIRAYACVIESILIHYSLGHQNAIGQSTKDEIWDRATSLTAFNTIQDPQINFYIFYAVQGAQRLKTNQGKLAGIMKRLTNVFQATKLLVDVATTKSDVVPKLMGAFQSLQKAYYHWENHSTYYDSLVVLKKLLRVAASDPQLFSRVKRAIRVSKPTGRENHLLYGTLDLLTHAVIYTQNETIKEEALKIILQYATVNDHRIQKKVVAALAGMVRSRGNEKVQSTGKALLELLAAAGTIEADEAKEALVEAVEEARERLSGKGGLCFENVIKFLLRRVAEIKDEGYPGISYVNLLAYSQQDTVPALLRVLHSQMGSDLTKPDVQGYTPYHMAAKEHNREMIEALAAIERQRGDSTHATVDLADHQGRTPLHHCAGKGYADVMRALLDAGANVHVVDHLGRTPLEVAIRAGKVQLVELLLERGARVSEESSEQTPIFVAARAGQEKVLKQLIHRAPTITPMEAVAIQEFIVGKDQTLNCSQLFAKFHQRRVQRDPAYQSLFAMFPERLFINGHGDFIVIKIDPGMGCPPLIQAIKKGDLALVKKMARDSFKLISIHSACDRLGNGPLHHAMEQEGRFGLEVTRLLIEGGANLGTQNRLGMTPLHMAVSRGCIELASLLLKIPYGSKAITNIKDKAGFSPLHLAATAGSETLVTLLLSRGADPSVLNASGVTALHMAAGCRPCDGAPCYLTEGAQALPPGGDSLRVIETLIKSGADPLRMDFHGNHALHYAAKAQQVPMVRFLLKNYPELFWRENRLGVLPIQEAFRSGDAATALAMLDAEKDHHTLMHKVEEVTKGRLRLPLLAAETGQAEALQTLIASEKECLRVSDVHKRGRLPLHVGCIGGHSEVVKVCLAEGSDVSERDRYQQTPLHLAVMDPPSHKVMHQLIQAGADLHARNGAGDTPLHEACAQGSRESVAYLIEQGAHPKAVDGDGNTPLHIAGRGGYLLVTELLIMGCKVDIHATNDDGKTALHSACGQNRLSVAKCLLRAGARTNVTDFYGMTPLHYAAQTGNQELVRLLLDHGADLVARDDEGENALHKAAFYFQIEVAELLCDLDRKRRHPSLLNGEDVRQERPLHETVKQSKIHGRMDRSRKELMISILVHRGAPINAGDEDGLTVLHVAAHNGDLAAIKHLLKLSASLPRKRRVQVDVLDRFHQTPLHLAAGKGHLDAVKLLLKSGAQKDSRAEKLETPLFAAVAQQQRAVAEHLLQAGASLYLSNAAQQTLVHVATEHEQVDLELLAGLVAAGPSLMTVVDHNGNTALHLAAARGNFEAAGVLLKGLQPLENATRWRFLDQCNAAGRTASEVAIEAGHPEFARKLDAIPKRTLGLKKQLYVNPGIPSGPHC